MSNKFMADILNMFNENKNCCMLIIHLLFLQGFPALSYCLQL